MFLIFDTETTGLPANYHAPLSDSDNWPRMVQLAWQLHDRNGGLIDQQSFIIKPQGYTIPFKAIQVHGITNERAQQEGVDLKEVLDIFSKVLQRAEFICGHNIDFDLSIVGAELIRVRIPDIFNEKKVVDTKNEETTNYCAIPGGKGGKYKWPTLTELYVKLFGEGFSEAHNAAFDVEANSRVLFELLKRGIISPPAWSNENREEIFYQSPDLSLLREKEKEWKLKTEQTKRSDGVSSNQDKTAHVSDGRINFVHLHNHTQFSVLQSTTDIQELVKKTADYNCPGVAITDHGNMYGAFLFWQAVDKQNKNIRSHNEAVEKGEKKTEKLNEIKCIIGCELYLCKDRKDKTRQDNGYAIPVIAKNKRGYENLSRLSSEGYTEGFYYVPRIDREFLLQYKSDLIVTTGSIQGEVPSLILNMGEEAAEQAFLWYKENFGDDFYVELNRHGLEDEDFVNEVLLKFAKKHGVKYFAANNNYYLEKKDAEAHDILLCVKESQLKETPIGKGRGFRYGMPNQEFYFKSPAEMQKLFHDLPEALECTLEIVDKIESYKLGRDVLLPKFNIPDEFKDPRDEDPNDEGGGKRGENAYLRYLTYEGAKKRYPDLTQEVRERLDFELATMERMGFPGYFLIVSDFTTKAREMGVSVGPGRGSAAGSAVAYCLGITNVDPIAYDLLFERFLNPDRISMPDIDIDFDDEGRDKVIDYVIQKYGYNQVAQIITYGTMGGKSAIRDTARVLNLPLQEADRLAKSFPESLEADLKSLLHPQGISEKYLEKIKDRREIVEQSHNFRKLAEQNNLEATVLKNAYNLEGCVRNTGVHACGVIITPDDMRKFVPVTKPKDSEMLLTQFDNSVAESAGLLKMDFLGLRTLTIIKDAIHFIKLRHNKEIDIDAIDFSDKKTLELFQRGETNGIFQFESVGMQKYLKELKPDAFSDLIAMNALYRPGPLAYIPNYINRKHGREAITYDLPGMEEFLKETYGITVYQEQVMRLSQKLANFTKGDADTLRKAMGKKQKDVLDKMKSKFLEGCQLNGHDTKIAEKIWKDWEAFASYAFNKSHSTCYAYLAFQTAYLKAHYPSEFMASVLNHSGSIDKISFFMEECKRMRIKVLGPDVNEGYAKFSVMPNGDIRFGMASIKGVGENVISALVKEREENGKFTSVFDLAARLDSKTINKKSIENLALAGAFDNFEGVHRAMFFKEESDTHTSLTELMIKFCNKNKTGNENSQASLFGEENEIQVSEPSLPKVEPWETTVALAKEKEVVGFFISGHPLDPYKIVFDHHCNINCLELRNAIENYKGRELSFGGIVRNPEHKVSKNGKSFGKLSIEDYFGVYELVLFGDEYLQFSKFMIPNIYVHIRGKAQEKRIQPGGYELKVTKMDLLENVKESIFSNLRLSMDIKGINEQLIEKLEQIFTNYPGKSNVEVLVTDKKENIQLKLYSKKNRVQVSEQLLYDLNQLADLTYELQ